jgi:hypothetical protein
LEWFCRFAKKCVWTRIFIRKNATIEIIQRGYPCWHFVSFFMIVVVDRDNEAAENDAPQMPSL